MPRRDRRGPEGMGPMSGRGMGLCNGSETAGIMGFGFAGTGYGRRSGRGRGFGGGRGLGASAFTPEYSRYAPTKEEEQAHLNQKISGLKGHLKDLENRLEKLKTEE